MSAPGAENKVMHASFRIGDTILLASDGQCLGRPIFQGFSLSLTLPTDARADQLFATLADGGEVQMPLTRLSFPLASAWSLTALEYPGCSRSRPRTVQVSNNRIC